MNWFNGIIPNKAKATPPKTKGKELTVLTL